MSNDFKLWSYQQKVEWLLEQVKKGTVDVEELASQVETNKDNIETNADSIETNTNDISSLDERVTALEEAPAPTGGVEIINVEIGSEPDPDTGMYALTISETDKAKILANPKNYALTFAEQHVMGNAIANYFANAQEMGYMYEFYFFSINQNDVLFYQYDFVIGEQMTAAMVRHTNLALQSSIPSQQTNYECNTGPNANELNLTSDQIREIYDIARYVGYIRVVDSDYTVDLHYDGFANNTVYFSGTKPVSGGSPGLVRFSITKVMNTYTQYYNY